MYGKVWPQSEAKNMTEGVDVFKMFYTQEIIEIIVRERNLSADRCIQSKGILLPL
jgi:hypothetical protein